jgi:hypothetical protein
LAGWVGVDVKGTVQMLEFHVGAGMRGANQALRKRRAEPCIRGYEWACRQCSVGHAVRDAVNGVEACARATHPGHWLRRMCSRCRRDSWFDPADVGDVCLECRAAAFRHAAASASRWRV